MLLLLKKTPGPACSSMAGPGPPGSPPPLPPRPGSSSSSNNLGASRPPSPPDSRPRPPLRWPGGDSAGERFAPPPRGHPGNCSSAGWRGGFFDRLPLPAPSVIPGMAFGRLGLSSGTCGPVGWAGAPAGGARQGQSLQQEHRLMVTSSTERD